MKARSICILSEGTFCLYTSLYSIITLFSQALHKLRTKCSGCFYVATNTKYTEVLAIRYASDSMVRVTTSSQ